MIASRYSVAHAVLLVMTLAACGGASRPAASSGAASPEAASSVQGGPAAAGASGAGAQPAASAPVAASKPASSPPADRVRAAYVGPFDNMAVMWIAKEKGLFANHGLDVDLQAVVGSPAGTAALVSHDLDIVEMSAPPVVSTVVQGTDLAMIAGFDNVFIFTLMVDPSIKTMAELKGKTAVVAQVGAENDVVLRKVLLQNGLQPDVDVHIAPMRDPAGQLTMIANKQAQAVLGSGSNLVQYQKAGTVPLLDIGKLKLPFQSAGLASTRAYVNSHRPQVLNFLKASVDAIRYLKSEPAGAQAIMGKYLKTEDRDVQQAAWKAQADFMEDVPYPTLPGIQEIMDEQQVTGHKPEDFADLSLIKELEQSGYFKQR
jgi:ABC-type nitrate/sulfonate/bicarbonate transport system substrate-binding protein